MTIAGTIGRRWSAVPFLRGKYGCESLSAATNRGCEVKSQLIAQLQALGYEIQDVGTDNGKSVDYPEFAAEVARRVCGGNVDRGILICGTGIGMCIAANKFDGIRAAVCHDRSVCRTLSPA